MESAEVEVEHRDQINLSIVIARTKDGKTLLRRINTCEIEFIDIEMPIGALAWQEMHLKAGEDKPVLVWCFIIDGGNSYVPVTLRHKDFAIALDSQKIKNSVRSVGDTVSYHQFWMASLVPRITSSYVYVVPRELIPKETRDEHPSVPWFIVEDQTPQDSRINTPKPKDISRYIYNSTKKTVYALCAHRTDVLMTMEGSKRCEKNAKLEIGKWYTAQWNPEITSVLTSIRLYKNEPPLNMYIQEYNLNGNDETLILIRDIIKRPSESWNRAGAFEWVTKHPLLNNVRFPSYCSFSKTDYVEVCFAKRTYRRDTTNCWEVVAVSNGILGYDSKTELYWLPKLMGDMDVIIPLVRHAFPFIKSLTDLEVMHYSRISGLPSYEEVTSARINAFMKYQETKKDEPDQPVYEMQQWTFDDMFEEDDEKLN